MRVHNNSPRGAHLINQRVTIMTHDLFRGGALTIYARAMAFASKAGQKHRSKLVLFFLLSIKLKVS